MSDDSVSSAGRESMKFLTLAQRQRRQAAPRTSSRAWPPSREVWLCTNSTPTSLARSMSQSFWESPEFASCRAPPQPSPGPRRRSARRGSQFDDGRPRV